MSSNKEFWEMFGLTGAFKEHDRALQALYEMDLPKNINVKILMDAYATNEEFKRTRTAEFVKKSGWRTP